MKDYGKLVLNALLDSYEGSSLFLGTNKKTVRIYFHFNSRTVPDYFDDTSALYDEIHRQMGVLEEKGLIRIYWRGRKIGHIIEKIALQEEQLAAAYAFVGRRGLSRKHEALLARIAGYEKEMAGKGWETDGDGKALTGKGREADEKVLVGETLRNFFGWIRDRVEKGKPIRAYVDLDDLQEFDDMVRGVAAVGKGGCGRGEGAGQERFVRELSMELYADSKRLEQLRNHISSVIVDFCGDSGRFDDVEDVFASFGVLKNPSVLMLKGRVQLNTAGGMIRLGQLRYGLGISSGDIDGIRFSEDGVSIRAILTVENLTAFHRAEAPGMLIIYLGGFHNEARRRLIQKAYQAFPGADLLHWGDIDAGGFKIYFDLRAKTGLPFVPLRMDAATLKTYEGFTKKLTSNDRKELERLRQTLEDRLLPGDIEESIGETLSLMMERDRKLEQEIVALMPS